MVDERQLRYLNLADTWPGFGRLRGLTINPGGSLTLARMPAFVEVLGEGPIPTEIPAGPAGVSGDPAGDIYLADPAGHRVLKLDTCTGAMQPLPCFGGEGSGPGQFDTPRGTLVGPRDALYVADSGNHRVQVVDLPTGQLRGIWGQPGLGDPLQAGDAVGRFNEPWGLAADQSGAVYVVERAGRRVQKFTPGGRVIPAFWETLQQELAERGWVLVSPTDIVAVAQEGEERLYLVDGGQHAVLIFDPRGHVHHRWQPSEAVEPAGIVSAERAIYVGDLAGQQITQFDLTGGLVGPVPGYRGPVAGLGLACDGSLLVYPGGASGVVRLMPGQAYALQGDFLAGPFEAGEGPTEWHRLRLLAEPLPVDAHVQLFTYTSHDSSLPPMLGPEEDPFPAQGGWRTAPTDEIDILILNPPARYLWIGGRLQGDGGTSPRLVQMQVSYPPETYLRHLPAVYHEDEPSRMLMERVLALFESVLGGLAEETGDLPLLFDPLAAPTGWAPWLIGWTEHEDQTQGPPDWLPWLANWLALELDESWSEARTRQAIAAAFDLYGLRGTLEGLRRMIKLYAGVEARIEEPARFSTPWSLGETSTLGINTRLAHAQAHGAVLGTTATLDESHLIEEEDHGAPLFEGIAHRFCVHVYRAELRQSCTLDDVVAVLDREKPAHTEYHLCVIEPRMRVGFQARIGIDTIVAGSPQGLTLDQGQPLGRETVLVGDEREAGGVMGHQARIGRSTTLT